MPKDSAGYPAASLFLQVAEDADDKPGDNPHDVQRLQERSQRDLQLHHPVPDRDVDEPQPQEGKPPLLRGAQGRTHQHRHRAHDQPQRQHPELRQRHHLPPTFLQVDQGRGTQAETRRVRQEFAGVQGGEHLHAAVQLHPQQTPRRAHPGLGVR